MYSKLTNLVIGFHGCDQTVFERAIRDSGPIKSSENSYDWLEHGIYFFEKNYQRVLELAQKSPKTKNSCD